MTFKFLKVISPCGSRLAGRPAEKWPRVVPRCDNEEIFCAAVLAGGVPNWPNIHCGSLAPPIPAPLKVDGGPLAFVAESKRSPAMNGDFSSAEVVPPETFPSDPDKWTLVKGIKTPWLAFSAACGSGRRSQAPACGELAGARWDSRWLRWQRPDLFFHGGATECHSVHRQAALSFWICWCHWCIITVAVWSCSVPPHWVAVIVLRTFSEDPPPLPLDLSRSRGALLYYFLLSSSSLIFYCIESLF